MILASRPSLLFSSSCCMFFKMCSARWWERDTARAENDFLNVKGAEKDMNGGKQENILYKICAWPFCLMAAKFWCSRPQKPTDWSSLIASGTVPALTGTHGGSNIGTQGIPRIGEGSVKLMLGGGIYETTSVLILFCYNDWKQSNIRVEYAHCRQIVKIKLTYLKYLLSPLFHPRPHLVPESPDSVESQNGVNSLTCFLVMKLSHHHLGHCIRHLHRAQQEQGSYVFAWLWT